MVYATVVRRDIVIVEEQAFLYCGRASELAKESGSSRVERQRVWSLHLLKLFTGVEISTRPVKRSGRPGDRVQRASRKTAAPR